MPTQSNVRQNLDHTLDAELEFKDAGAITASAAAEVDSSAQIIDTGGAYFEGDMVIDITAVEVDSGDEKYLIHVQASDSSTFASTIQSVVAFEAGDSAVVSGDIDTGTGRYILPFSNQVGETIYRYLRVYTFISGTIVTGINYTANATHR